MGEELTAWVSFEEMKKGQKPWPAGITETDFGTGLEVVSFKPPAPGLPPLPTAGAAVVLPDDHAAGLPVAQLVGGPRAHRGLTPHAGAAEPWAAGTVAAGGVPVVRSGGAVHVRPVRQAVRALRRAPWENLLPLQPRRRAVPGDRGVVDAGRPSKRSSAHQC